MRLATTSLLAGLLAPLLAACSGVTEPASPGVEVATSVLEARKPRPQPARPPVVVFVHGWNSSAATWGTMVGRFKRDGWTDGELVAFSYNTAQSNAVTADLIRRKVDSVRAATGAAQVHLVTHSMGSLSARYYLRNLGGDTTVASLSSLAGADHGTTTAYACLQTACLEMWPGSSFLGALNALDETWGAPRYATWRSPCDEVINPRSSTVLEGATNSQTTCLLHGALKDDALVYAQVRDWIRASPLMLLARR